MDIEAIISTPDYKELSEKLSGRIIKLEQDLAAKSEYNAQLDDIVSRHRVRTEQFEDILKDAVMNEDIDPDLAEIFAKIFGFDLLQTMDIEVNVTFRGTVTLPLNQNAEDIDWDSELNVSCDSVWGEINFDLEDVSQVHVEVI